LDVRAKLIWKAAALIAVSAAFAIAGWCQQAKERQRDTIASSILSTWKNIESDLVSAADAMPEERYSFVPTNGEFKDARTFAQQVKHVACGNLAFFNEIEGKTPPPDCDKGGPDPAKTKAELMKHLRDSFAYADRVLATTTSANVLAPVAGPYGGPSTRLGIAVLAVWHASDHYGQMIEYLRMNGIVPPASR
jgi:uncharacterized damage-inducible protein DinB